VTVTGQILMAAHKHQTTLQVNMEPGIGAGRIVKFAHLDGEPLIATTLAPGTWLEQRLAQAAATVES
jgi:hypothetical protein